MKKFTATAALVCLTLILLLETIGLAWMSDNGMSSPIDITSNVHKSYFASGDGTKELVYDKNGKIVSGPYEIATPLQLYYFSWLQNLGYFNEDITENGMVDTVYFRLSKDLDMEYTDENGDYHKYILPPIGTVNNPFLGNFDGEGHTITDLTIENAYGSLLEPPEGTQNFSGAEIIGFFGVIGELAEGDYKYDTQANEVKNLVLENLTVKTQTDNALIGLVAGYVNGTVNCVGVVGSKVNIKSGTKALSYTANVSDYSLIGYCTDAYKDNVTIMDVVLTNPNITDSYTVVPTVGGDGETQGWGGSVKMMDIYNWLTDISNNRASTNSNYTLERTDVVNLDGTTVTIDRTNASKLNYTVENFGSFVITNSQPNYVNFVSGASRVTKFEYAYTENNVTVYYITDGTNYLCYDGTNITNTTTQENATKWYASNGTNGGVISTVVNGNVYYLRIESGISVISHVDVDLNDLPSWNITNNVLTFNGTGIICTDGTWVIPVDRNVKISYRNNNTTYYFTNNGTTSTTRTTSQNDAAIWSIKAVSGGYTVSTVINDTTYYLGYPSLGNNQNAQVTPNLSTTPTTWQFANNQIYIVSGNTTHYIRYSSSGGGFVLQSYDSNNTLNLTDVTSSSSTSTGTLVSAGTEKEIVCNESAYIDNSLENHYYDANGDKVVSDAGITYFPLSTTVSVSANKYEIASSNTGYIIGAEWGAIEKNEHDQYGNVRIASYDAGSMQNYTTPYTMTYKTGGKFKTISEIPTTGKLSDSQQQMLANLGLSKYADCYADYRSSITNKCYGIHFMQASVSITNTMRADVFLNGENLSNYEMPTNCIDFNLYDRGFINFVAGSYFTAQTPQNNSFFSIYEITRDPDDVTTITAIKEIRKIYAKLNSNGEIDTSRAYYYTYLIDGSEVGASSIPEGYEMVFDSRWITHPNDSSYYGAGGSDPSAWSNNRAFYFEVPVNAGEYAIGSTEGRTGAYLTYLDLAANAQLIERSKEYEEITETFADATVPNGVELLEPVTSPNKHDTSTINSKDSAFVSINQSGSGEILFEKTDDSTVVHSAKNGTEAEFISNGTTLKDGNGNTMSVPITTNTKIERTTYRDYNLNTGVTTITVITKTTVTEGGTTTVSYTKTVTATDPDGNVTEETTGPQATELFPETVDPDTAPKTTKGNDLLNIRFVRGSEIDVTVAYTFVPAGTDENGAATTPTYTVTVTNPGDEAISLLAQLTEAALTSGITFIITDGTTSTPLNNNTNEQTVTIATAVSEGE